MKRRPGGLRRWLIAAALALGLWTLVILFVFANARWLAATY